MSTLHDLINEDGIYCNCKTDVLDTTATSYVEVTPDVGIILKNGDEVLRAKKGDLIESLVYVDENLAMQTITGSLHTVMFITKRLNGRDYIKAEGLIIDKSTEFNSDLVRIPIADIREFKGNSVDPDDIKIYDVALDGDKLSFVTLFKPSMVTWNGDLISVKLVGDTPTGSKYTATVPNVLKTNTITVIGLGSAVTTRTVEGLVPGIEPTYSDVVVQDTIKALSEVFPDSDDTVVDEDAVIENCYVPVATGIYGGKSCKIQINGREAASYEETDRVQVIVGEAIVDLCPFRVKGGKMEVLAPMLACILTTYPTEPIRILANDFAVKIPNTKGDWLQPFVITGASLYGSSDMDDDVVYSGNTVQVTRSNRDVGVSLTVVDYAGVAVPQDTMMVECAPETEGAFLPTTYTFYKAGIPNKSATITLFEGKGDGTVKTIASKDNQLNLVIPECGMGEVNVVFKDVLPKPKPEIAKGFNGVSAVSNIQWIEAVMASAVGNFDVPDKKLYIPLLTNIDEQFDNLTIHVSCGHDVSSTVEEDGDDAELSTRTAVYTENDQIRVYSAAKNAYTLGAPYVVDTKTQTVSINVFLLAYLSVIDATESVILEVENTMVALPDLSEFAGTLGLSQPKVTGNGASISVDDNAIIADLVNYDSMISFNLADSDGIALGNGTIGLVVAPIDHDTHKVGDMWFEKVTNHVLFNVNPAPVDEDGTLISGEVLEESEDSDEWMFVIPGVGMANVHMTYRYHLPVKVSKNFNATSVEEAYLGLINNPALTDTCYVPVLSNVRNFEDGMEMVVSNGVPAKSISVQYNTASTLAIQDGEISYNNHPAVKLVNGVVSVHVLTLIPILNKLTSIGGTIQFLLNGESITAPMLVVPAGNSVMNEVVIAESIMKDRAYLAEGLVREPLENTLTMTRYSSNAYIEMTMEPSLLEEGKFLIMTHPNAMPAEGDVTSFILASQSMLTVAPGGEFIVEERFEFDGVITEPAVLQRFKTYASKIGSIYVDITCQNQPTSMVPEILVVDSGYTEDAVEQGVAKVESWLNEKLAGNTPTDTDVVEGYFVPVLHGLLSEPESVQIGMNPTDAYSYNADETITVTIENTHIDQPAFVTTTAKGLKHTVLMINPVVLYTAMALAGEANQTHVGIGINGQWSEVMLDTLIPYNVGVSAPVSSVIGFGGTHTDEPNVPSAQLIDGTITVVRYDTGYGVKVMISDNTEKKMTIAMAQGVKLTSLTASYLNEDGSYVVLEGEDPAEDITTEAANKLSYQRLLVKNVGFTDIDMSLTDKVPEQSALADGFSWDQVASTVSTFANSDDPTSIDTNTLFVPVLNNFPASETEVLILATNKGSSISGSSSGGSKDDQVTLVIDSNAITAPIWKVSEDGVLSVNAVSLFKAALSPSATAVVVGPSGASASIKLKDSALCRNNLKVRQASQFGGVYNLQNNVTLNNDGSVTVNRWDYSVGADLTIGTQDADFTGEIHYIEKSGSDLRLSKETDGVLRYRAGSGTTITTKTSSSSERTIYVLGDAPGLLTTRVTWNDNLSHEASVYGVCTDPDFTYETVVTKIKQLTAKTDLQATQVSDDEFYVSVALNVPNDIRQIDITCLNADGETATLGDSVWGNAVTSDQKVRMVANALDNANDLSKPGVSYPAFKVVDGKLLLSVILLHECILCSEMDNVAKTTIGIHGVDVELETATGLPYITKDGIGFSSFDTGGTGIVNSGTGANGAYTIERTDYNGYANRGIANYQDTSKIVYTVAGSDAALIVASVALTCSLASAAIKHTPLIDESGVVVGDAENWNNSTCTADYTDRILVTIAGFEGSHPGISTMDITWENKA